jgi:serine/threonine-protein kinase RsbW
MDDAALRAAADCGGAGAAGDVSLAVTATPQGVREALIRLRRDLTAAGLAPDDVGTAEMVLAEVMNNIVEHAYAGCSGARLDLQLRVCRGGGGLSVHARDTGAAMPGGTLPEGTPHRLDVGMEDLPEGGFGWALIRTLTEDLTYRRAGGENHLNFRVPLPELI